MRIDKWMVLKRSNSLDVRPKPAESELPVLKEKGTHMIDQIITAPATAHQTKVILLTTDQKETSRLMTVVSPQSLNFLCSFGLCANILLCPCQLKFQELLVYKPFLAAAKLHGPQEM